jgi:hypothetical protein
LVFGLFLPVDRGYLNTVLAVVILALAAAALYAVSDFLEQRVAHRTAVELSGRDHARALSGARAVALLLLRNRIWILGWLVGTVAYLVQAAALHLGSIAVVQALQVTTLLFTLPLSTIGTTLRPRLLDYLAGGAVCLGLGLFLFARGVHDADAQPYRYRLMALVFCATGAIVLLCLTAIRQPAEGTLRATLLAVAAGIAFATSATMVKLTTALLADNGPGPTARDWPGYTLAVFAIASVVLQQAAFAAGKLPLATTAISVTNPLCGTLIAVLAFDEPLPGDPGRLALFAFAAALVVAGLTVLPRSPLLSGSEPLPELEVRP